MNDLPHPEERPEDASRRPRGRSACERAGNVAKSPLIKASLFSRRQPLTCRSAEIADPLELLMEDECYRPPTGSVAVEGACIMFSNALFEAAARRADVI
jgi:hypothetical protein